MASGHEGSNEAECTNSFRRGRRSPLRVYDRHDGMFDARSAEPLKVEPRCLVHRQRGCLPTQAR